MAGKTFVGVNGVARKPKALYVGVNGVARKVKAAYVGVNGIAKQIWPNSILPYTYQQVEYILNSGRTQVITPEFPNSEGKYASPYEIPIDSNNTLEIEFEFNAKPGQTYIFGTYTIPSNALKNTGGLEYSLRISSNNPYLFYLNFGNSMFHQTTIEPVANTRYKIIFNQSGGKFFINGTPITTTTVTFTGSSNKCICVFDEQQEFKLYHLKITRNNAVIRDMYPCYRTSDNVIGMYDLVKNRFHTNAGTGTFYKGPNVG